MYRNETSLEEAVVDHALNKLGVPSIKLNLTGNTGWPDRLFLIADGRGLYIEFKQPGEELESKQAYNHTILKARGYNVQVHDNKEEAVEAIKAAMGAATLHEKGHEVPAVKGVRRSAARPRIKKN